MSSLKDKKASLLAKIERQKAKQKAQVYTIPDIKLSSADEQKKAKKTFIPNAKSLAKKSKVEDSMREFLAEVNSLNADDFDIPPKGYTNKIVSDGYSLYMDTYNKDAIEAEDEENPDISGIHKKADDSWLELPVYAKSIWVIKGYGNAKDAEWGRKQFADLVDRTIYNEIALHKFIDDYLERDISYDKFVTHWKAQRGDAYAKDAIEAETAAAIAADEISKQGTRLAVTEEEQARIDDMRERLVGYEKAYEQLEENSLIREEYLIEQSHEELVELAKPIMGRKTKGELIELIIGSEYTPIRKEKYKELFGDKWEYYAKAGKHLTFDERRSRPIPSFIKEKEEYNEFLQDFDKEVDERKATLNELSYSDLVLEATSNKTAPRLVQLLSYSEFHRSRDGLQTKISNLRLEIRNLSLGKYIPRTGATRTLKYKERNYRNALLVQIRRIELETMTVEQLRLHSSTIGGFSNKTVIKGIMKTTRVKDSDLIFKILSTEFPGVDLNAPVPKATYNQTKNVLATLSDDQIHVLAYANGVKRPEKRGKYRNIDSILRVEFPAKQEKSTKHLVVGRFVKNWSFHKRKEELSALSSKELKQEALTIGMDIPKGTTDKQMIKQILSWEEHIARLIPKEDAEKEKLAEKISQFTGTPAYRYLLWSTEELNQRLLALQETSNEYWTEIEQERLYNKLSQMVDITQRKYKNADKWSLKKLRRELKKHGGDEWETYTPLIEDYAFVKCMDKYNVYEWIDGKVTAVWLSSPDGTIPSLDYIHDDVEILEDGHRWYQANQKFFALQCNKNNGKRVQKDDVLISRTLAGKPVALKVGYTVVGHEFSANKYKFRTHMVETEDGRMVKRSFIIQDEVLFNIEKRYKKRSQQTESETIKDILNSTVTERTAGMVRNIISRALLDIAPLKKDYGVVRFDENELKKASSKKDPKKLTLFGKSVDSNTPYMQILMKTLRDTQEQSNKDLFKRAANLIVYLKTPEAKTFLRNIEKEYYLPEILATLSPSEKFPEVYQDPKLTGTFLDQITASIDNKIYKFVYQLGESEYKNRNPMLRTRTAPGGQDFTRSIKTTKRLSACANKARVKGIPETEIIYYKEGGIIYCFSVDDLYNRLVIQEDVINPETNKQFDIEFVRRFGELYNKRLSDDGLLNTYFQKKYGFDMGEMVQEKEKADTRKSEIPIIAPDLWEKIGVDIAELEDQLSNEQPGDGDSVDENREDERREVDVEEGVRETVDISENEACEYCKNHVSDDSIKSLIYHNDESRIIQFCSFKCFENKNDWDKYKIKRVKRAKKTIKKAHAKHEAVKKQVNESMKPKVKEKFKLTREEIKKRKKIMKKQVKDGVAAFDKVAFPLMSKTELREIAKAKGIKIPGNLSKMGTASFLYKQLHPKAKKGVLKEKTAEKEMVKIETRRDKKKRKAKEEKAKK